MKYLKKFNTAEERQAYIDSTPLPIYPYVHYIASDNDVIFSNQETETPFYIEGKTSVQMMFSGVPYEYSYDGKTWNTITNATTRVNIAANERCYLRATGLTSTPSSYMGIGKFGTNNNSSSVQFSIGGNIMSLLYGSQYRGKTTIEQAYCFASMFEDRREAIDASRLALPATTLAKACYYRMFEDCYLISAPTILPATILAEECYRYMFYGCGGIKTAPILPATTLARYCYSSMFYGCGNLLNAPNLPATKMEESCYSDMFKGCRSLKNAPALPATTLARYCYESMFRECYQLIETPVLPAEILAGECYRYMFKDCTNLITINNIKGRSLKYSCYESMFEGCTSLKDAAIILSAELYSQCCYAMFKNCTSLINAPVLPATILAEHCYKEMFKGCTSLNNAPELPAEKLIYKCYAEMFNGCSNLNYIKAMFTTTPRSSECEKWVSGVATSGTFVKNANATWDVTGVNGIPEGWTIETAIQ